MGDTQCQPNCMEHLSCLTGPRARDDETRTHGKQLKEAGLGTQEGRPAGPPRRDVGLTGTEARSVPSSLVSEAGADKAEEDKAAAAARRPERRTAAAGMTATGVRR